MNASSIFDDVSIVVPYQFVMGTVVMSLQRKDEITVQCPDCNHVDQNASCDLNVRKNAFCCRSCGAHGGIADLIIASGNAADRASAARWLEAKLGRESRTSPRSAPRRLSHSDVENAVKASLVVIKQRESDAEHAGAPIRTLSRHVSAARRRVRETLGNQIAPEVAAEMLCAPEVVWYEEPAFCSDPFWRMFVIRAIEDRARRCNVLPDDMRSAAASNVLVADAIIAEAAGMLRAQARYGAIQ